MQAEDDDDDKLVSSEWRSKINRGQHSKLCSMATKLGQKNPL